MDQLLEAMRTKNQPTTTPVADSNEGDNSYQARDVDQMTNGADELEVKVTTKSQDKETSRPEPQKPTGKVTIVGNTTLQVRQDLSPDDLKHVPKPTDYIDNKGILGDIATFINLNMPVLVEGETGVGKTSAFRYLAGLTQSPYRRLNLNGSTTVDEFVGKVMLDKEGTYWVDGVLIDAMRKGHWLVLDEINAALPEILFVLHSLLDDDGYVVLAEHNGEVVRPHSNFRVFATMNPSEGQYSGTKELNQAFLDRFAKMTFDFPTLAQEKKMVTSRYPNLKYVTKDKLDNMLRYVQEMRTAYTSGAQEFLVSPRGTLQWVHLSEEFKDIGKAAEYALVYKAPVDERAGIRDVLKLKFGMGVQDYIPQTKKGQKYSVGDEVVVHVPADPSINNLVSDYTALVEITEVDAPPVREDGHQEVERIVYKLKVKAQTHKIDLLNDRQRLGNMLTASYQGEGILSS